MILDRPAVAPQELERRTGWAIKPQGACKGELCVPLRGIEPGPDDAFDARALAERLGMALLHDERHDVWALGPDSVAGRALASAELPEITLPDREGRPFSIGSMRGQKMLLLAWASC